jgi:SNF2 family DNA or RNA helicase
LHRNAAEAALFAVRVCRALLGDDMGLGKTIEAIAATEMLARHFGVSKVLVICPTSLKYQWQSERDRVKMRRASSTAVGAASERLRLGRLLQDHKLRETQGRSRPDRRLGPNW